MRLILFTGKGGVGKTTLSAATALLCAKKGHKTLVISTDAAHSLSDSLEVPLTNRPSEIAPNLFGREVNALEEIEKKWGEIRVYLAEFFASQGVSSIEAEELSVFPGMEELFSLMEIRNYRKSGEFDIVIVDCAPTGDTLRLLSAPEITNWYLKHIFPIQRTAAKAVRPVASRILPFPFPEDRIFEALKKLTLQLAEMKEILEDSKNASIRLVVNPEKMVIKEAQRAYTFFNLFGFSVDAIIINRLFPSEIEEPYFDEWKSIQEGHRQTIEDIFAPLPIFSLPLFSREIVGLGLLERIGGTVYGDQDPSRVFFTQKPIQIQKENGRYIMTLYLPFLEKAAIDLTQKGEELVVRAGSFKRNILLPRVLLHASVRSARYEGDLLRITFAPEAREGGP
jgi:arsenite-transporting ATPase